MSRRFLEKRLAWLACVATVSFPLISLAAEDLRIGGKVPADWPDKLAAPVVIPVPDAAKLPPALNARLQVEGGSTLETPARFEPADPQSATTSRVWLTCRLPAADRGKPVIVRLSPARTGAVPAYRSKDARPLLNISDWDGKPILSYYYGEPAPGWKLPLTSFIHPLIGLDGETLTDLIPADHLHHRGVFWAWVRHQRGEQSVGDWWHPTEMRAVDGTCTADDGPVFTRLTARSRWVHEKKGGSPLPIMREYVVSRVFATTPEGRAIDIDIALTALVDDFRFGGTTEKGKGYGGLTFRYAPATDIRIDADGKHIEKDLNQLRAAWADWSGRFKDASGKPRTDRSGVAILVHPLHPDFPPEWITRYYGVLNVSYPGLRMLELPQDRPLHLRYRLWIHRGDAAAGKVDEQQKALGADWQWKAQHN